MLPDVAALAGNAKSGARLASAQRGRTAHRQPTDDACALKKALVRCGQPPGFGVWNKISAGYYKTKLELIQSHVAQKPVLRGEVGCACVAREVSVERGGMGERGCARRLGGWVWV